MDFHDFRKIIGKSGNYEIHPQKFCASLVPLPEGDEGDDSVGERALYQRRADDAQGSHRRVRSTRVGRRSRSDLYKTRTHFK